MNKLKILQTPIRFFPYIGGVENHVYYLAKELTKLGHKVKILCANEPKSNKKLVEGIKVERLNYQFKITNTNIALSLPSKLFKSNFDIVHTHMPTPWTSDWSVLAAKIMGKKSVITIHNDMDKSSLISKIVTKIYLNTFFRITLALVDKIILVNPDWIQSFKATKNILLNHKNKIYIIPNGINLEIFDKTIEKKEEKNTIIFVSILDKHHSFKGLNYLLKAVQLVKKTNPEIKLLVIGEGEMKKHYQNITKQLGIETNVNFMGEIKQNNLVNYYKKASIFILPSIEIEGFGIVLLEAMACKLPVITTNIAGVWNDVKKNNAGIIVKIKDAKALANSINILLNDHKLSKEMGNNGYKLIKQKYDWKLITKQVENIYKEVLN